MINYRCPPKAIAIEIAGNGPQSPGRWTAEVPHSHDIEVVKHPEYFGGLRGFEFRPGDRISVMPEDKSWFLELMVRAVVPITNQLHTAVINEQAFAEPVTAHADYDIRWIGGDSYHGIFVKGDASPKEAGFITAEDAQLRLQTIVADQAPATAKPARRSRAKKTEAA